MDNSNTIAAIVTAVLLTMPFNGAVAKENVSYVKNVIRQTDPVSISDQMNLELNQKIQDDLWKTIDIASQPMAAVKHEEVVSPENILAGTKNRMLQVLR